MTDGVQDEQLGSQKLINKTEFIRLIEQALYKLGYDSVAQQLEHESVRGRPAGSS